MPRTLKRRSLAVLRLLRKRHSSPLRFGSLLLLPFSWHLADPNRTIQIDFDVTEHLKEPPWERKVKNTVDLFEKLLPALNVATTLRQLKLSNLRRISKTTRKLLRSASFPTILKLELRRTAAANLLIKACANLSTFITDYPCLEEKKTLPILASSGVASVTFDCDSWKPDLVESESHIKPSIGEC
jgi:hypothetical protein